ncbi:hypothetical protein TNCV_1854171 [Trichonephila clavipes]|nr:hypothetical protein TNCV_1854171 [Trichonephila clavipes]
MSLRRSPPKDQFPVRELMTSEQSRGKISKTGQSDAYVLRLVISLFPPHREMTSAVPTPVSGFKVRRTRGDK